MSITNYRRFCEELDDLIKQGQLIVVQKRLEQIAVRKIPALHRHRVANIARRVQLFRLALRILEPLSRNSTQWENQCEPEALFLQRRGTGEIQTQSKLWTSISWKSIAKPTARALG